MPRSDIAAKAERLRTRILPMLRCIRCGAGELELASDALRCRSCGQTYRVHKAIPLMTYTPKAAVTFDSTVNVENRYSENWLALIQGASGQPLLDLGSGNNSMSFDHVVKLDVLAHPNVDVVGLAENLPFHDRVFRTVMSGAVFEHVADPFLAIDQVHRVLADDGDVYIETAFLQPVHAFPNHYFNMTLQGLVSLCRSFESIDSGVQAHQYPSFALRWILESWVDKLPRGEREDFLSATVAEVIEEYRENAMSKRWLRGFTPKDIEELACGVYFHGRKQARQGPDLDAHPEPVFQGKPISPSRWLRDVLIRTRRRAGIRTRARRAIGNLFGHERRDGPRSGS